MTEQAKHIILCVTNDLSYDQRMQKTALSLVQLGFVVTLVGRKLKTSIPLQAAGYKQHRLKCRFVKGVLFYLEFNIRLAYYLFLETFDTATACDLDTIIGVSIAGKIRRKTIVFDAHEYFTEVPELQGNPFKKWIWRRIENYFVPLANKRYTVNPSLAGVMEDRMNCSFDVVENYPIKRPVQYKISPSRHHTLLYQGVLNEGRGLLELLTAMVQLKEVHCRIIGGGPLEDEIKLEIDKLGLEERVTLFGYVSPDEMWKYAEKASIGLNLLSGNSLNYYYSSANKFYDYIQAGIPSINMSFPEYVRVNEIYEVAELVHDLSSQSIQNAVRNILHEDKYRKMVDQCQRAAKGFIWEKNLDTLSKIYTT